jgi:hypothetical protein
MLCEQEDEEPGVNAVQLSQTGALVAWSIGADGSLACMDVTTCKIRTSMKVPSDSQL